MIFKEIMYYNSDTVRVTFEKGVEYISWKWILFAKKQTYLCVDQKIMKDKYEISLSRFMTGARQVGPFY